MFLFRIKYFWYHFSLPVPCILPPPCRLAQQAISDTVSYKLSLRVRVHNTSNA